MTNLPESAVVVADYVHRTGEHCASTALRNILAHQGTKLSEGMVFGLASGLGFFYVASDAVSPTRMFHGRTATLEDDLGRNTGLPIVDRPLEDDDEAFRLLRERIDAGQPVMVSTDTFYLGYHATSSHFPGHRCVVVGYDDASRNVYIADRKFDELKVCSYDELRDARNAPDYPMSSHNQFGDVSGPLRLERPLGEAAIDALRRNARAMLGLDGEGGLPGVQAVTGVAGIRALADELPQWHALSDWSWASRFGYQVVIRRGAAGTFFRSLEADFLREAAEHVPGLAEAVPASEMDTIADRWCALAAVLKDQSERETCEPRLFREAAAIAGELADREERFFEKALGFVG